MGELDPWLDEAAIRKIWSNFGENVNVKLIRDKFTGSNAGYCFVEFSSPVAAAKALQLNGQQIPTTQSIFKLNWASGGDNSMNKNSGNSGNSNSNDKSPEYSIFVGDVGSEVSEFQLFQLFQSKYPSCKSVKIMTDPQTNVSRGYGFVRFADESEQQRALTEMNGMYCGSRPLRVQPATPKGKNTGTGSQLMMNQNVNNANVALPGFVQQPAVAQSTNPSIAVGNQNKLPFQNNNVNFFGNNTAPVNGSAVNVQPLNQYTDPNNTTVFVGGLSSTVTEDELRRHFAGFGDITYVKIPSGKGCGFVQYVQRQSAEAAITQMQGYPIGNSRVRLSWGRSQNSMNNNSLNANQQQQLSMTGGNGMIPNGFNGNMVNANYGSNQVPNSLVNATSTSPSANNAQPGFLINGNSTLSSGVSNGYHAAPPQGAYPQMSIAPSQGFSGPFGPINPQTAHMHPSIGNRSLISHNPSSSIGDSNFFATSNGNNNCSPIGFPPHIGVGPSAGSGGLIGSVPGKDPSEPISVARLNEMYLAAKDGRLDRVAGDGRGYHGVYAQ